MYVYVCMYFRNTTEFHYSGHTTVNRVADNMDVEVSMSYANLLFS